MWQLPLYTPARPVFISSVFPGLLPAVIANLSSSDPNYRAAPRPGVNPYASIRRPSSRGAGRRSGTRLSTGGNLADTTSQYLPLRRASRGGQVSLSRGRGGGNEAPRSTRELGMFVQSDEEMDDNDGGGVDIEESNGEAEDSEDDDAALERQLRQGL